MTIPLMLGHYFPPGILGLGLTALMALFMSGMAGNVTAFNTVWTYDIYQSYIRQGRQDSALLWMGRMAPCSASSSCGRGYLAAHFNNIMDFLQLVFAFVNAPLFATFLLGMFWKRTTGHGAFLGSARGILARGAASWPDPFRKAQQLGSKAAGSHVRIYPSEMAQNFWTAILAWSVCFRSDDYRLLVTTRKKSDAELGGLVWALTPRILEEETSLV